MSSNRGRQGLRTGATERRIDKSMIYLIVKKAAQSGPNRERFAALDAARPRDA